MGVRACKGKSIYWPTRWRA